LLGLAALMFAHEVLRKQLNAQRPRWFDGRPMPMFIRRELAVVLAAPFSVSRRESGRCPFTASGYLITSRLPAEFPVGTIRAFLRHLRMVRPGLRLSMAGRGRA
jgi:hypothetical protein